MRARRRLRLHERRARQQHREFLAALPRQHVVAMQQRAAHHAGEALQRAVAVEMAAVMVVVGLEMVDVDGEHRERPGAVGRRPPQSQPLFLEAAVVEGSRSARRCG